MAIMKNTKFNELDWEAKEFDWTGKSFYYVSLMNIMGKPLNLGGKMEELMRELRQNGYKMVSNIILVQYKTFGGRIMTEVEKQDKYDAQVAAYEMHLTVDTVVQPKGKGLAPGIKRIRSRVTSKRTREPREIYYWPVDGASSERYVVFSFT